jgi:hypothetical protein
MTTRREPWLALVGVTALLTLAAPAGARIAPESDEYNSCPWVPMLSQTGLPRGASVVAPMFVQGHLQTWEGGVVACFNPFEVA